MGFGTFFDRLLAKHETRPELPVVNATCTEFEVNNWALSRFVSDRLIPLVGVHPFPVNELMLMAAVVCRLQPTHVFEWGTNIGKSARIFYETAKFYSLRTQIHTIDLPDGVDHVEHPGQLLGHMVEGLPEVHMHVGDGLDTALEILAKLPKDRLRPLFFVDGDHAYESVRRELHGIVTNVPYASILLHDTFKQSKASGYNLGPYEATCEILEKYSGRYKVLEQNLGLPGMTFLWQVETP